MITRSIIINYVTTAPSLWWALFLYNIDNILKICYNIRVKSLPRLNEKAQNMKRTFKLTLLVCLLLIANLFTLTSCFLELPEDEPTPSAPFTTLTYEGRGSKVIKNINVPKGKFVISGYASITLSSDYDGGFFNVSLTDSENVYESWLAYLNSSSKTVEKAELFVGPMNAGILEIQADDDVSWTITIEAAG